jgi:hypothetical protein
LPRRKAWGHRCRSRWLPKPPNFDRIIPHKLIHYCWLQRNRCYDHQVRFRCSEINSWYQSNSRDLVSFYCHGIRALPCRWTCWICSPCCWNFGL